MGNYLCFIVDYGPGDWGKVAPPCSGQLQSPINIVSSLAEVNTTHNDLVVNFDNMDGTVTGFLINNGHAPKVIVDNNQGGATVTGGPLGQNMFILQQFHFHFGCNSSAGSEHTLDGKTFASEVGITLFFIDPYSIVKYVFYYFIWCPRNVPHATTESINVKGQ